MILKDEHCTCNGEVHDECRPCADCGEAPALNDAADGPVDYVGTGWDDGEVMWLCDDCHEERVAAEQQRLNEQREEDRPLTLQQQAWFDAYARNDR